MNPQYELNQCSRLQGFDCGRLCAKHRCTRIGIDGESAGNIEFLEDSVDFAQRILGNYATGKEMICKVVLHGIEPITEDAIVDLQLEAIGNRVVSEEFTGRAENGATCEGETSVLVQERGDLPISLVDMKGFYMEFG